VSDQLLQLGVEILTQLLVPLLFPQYGFQSVSYDGVAVCEEARAAHVIADGLVEGGEDSLEPFQVNIIGVFSYDKFYFLEAGLTRLQLLLLIGLLGQGK
jgi:hypothetical protein